MTHDVPADQEQTSSSEPIDLLLYELLQSDQYLTSDLISFNAPLDTNALDRSAENPNSLYPGCHIADDYAASYDHWQPDRVLENLSYAPVGDSSMVRGSSASGGDPSAWPSNNVAWPSTQLATLQAASRRTTTLGPFQGSIEQPYNDLLSQQLRNNSDSDFSTLETFPSSDDASVSLIPSHPSSQESMANESDLDPLRVISDKSDGPSRRSALYGRGSSASNTNSDWVEVGDVHALLRGLGAWSTPSKDPLVDSSAAEKPMQEEAWTHVQNPESLAVTHSEEGSGALSKKRRPFTDYQLKKVNAVRQVAACIRCQLLHETCDLEEVCSRCKDVQPTATVWKMPCIRCRVTDAVLNRTGALLFPNGVRKVTQWANRRKITISLYHAGIASTPPPSSRPTAQVICQQFIREPDDPISKKWVKEGKPVELKLPTFAIPVKQLNKTAKMLDGMVNQHQELLMTELEHEQQSVVQQTLREAARNASKNQMINGALRIAILTRLAGKSFNITGHETLGIAPVDDTTSPYYGRIPIPPLLDAQIDQIWMGMMAKLRKRVLSELKAKIMSRDRKLWYEIFLTILELLVNLEFMYQNQNRQLQRYCMEKPRSSYPFGQWSMMQNWEHSAANLLAHFRVASQGHVPFTQDWSDDNLNAAGVDNRAAEFLLGLNASVKSQSNWLKNQSKASPGDPMVWVSALFVLDDDS